MGMDIENLDELEIELPPEFDGLPVFLVGGAVRDAIRGVPFEDVDLMVAEVAPSEMEERGFREIDSSNNETFGVFQDSLGREVALARQERSTGDGHKDFDVTPVEPSVEASEAVTRDLKRRDFTVNAMAFDLRWDVLHDPHGGVQDLKDGVLCAVNPHKAFIEDPLRVVRAARFGARLDMIIDSTTKGAMWESATLMPELPQERVRMEMEKALVQADEPSRFFEILDEVAALDYTFPELWELKGVPAGPEEYHAEGTAFEHTMMVLDEMKEIRPDDELALLMALGHDLGKAVTPKESLPSHPNHGKAGLDIIDNMQDRLSLSNEQASAMKEASRFHMRMHDVDDLRVSTVINTWEQTNHFHRLIALMVSDCRGREPESEYSLSSVVERFGSAKLVVDEWTGERLMEEGYSPDEMGGGEFGNLLHQKRVEAMRDMEAHND